MGERERRHESLPALIAKEIEIHIRYSVCVRDVSLYTDECHPTLMSVCPRAPNINIVGSMGQAGGVRFQTVDTGASAGFGDAPWDVGGELVQPVEDVAGKVETMV